MKNNKLNTYILSIILIPMSSGLLGCSGNHFENTEANRIEKLSLQEAEQELRNCNEARPRPLKDSSKSTTQYFLEAYIRFIKKKEIENKNSE